MNHWFLYEVEQQRRRDEIERAARRHYAREIQRQATGEQQPQRRYEILLAALGDLLIAWGCRLQTRYRRLAETTHTLSAQTPLAQPQSDSGGCA